MLDDNTLQKVSDLLESNGVQLSVDNTNIDNKDFLEFIKNPKAFLAKQYGISIEDYDDWHNGVHLRCCGFTKNNKPCKLPPKGASGHDYYPYDPVEYAKLKGGYCEYHGG